MKRIKQSFTGKIVFLSIGVKKGDGTTVGKKHMIFVEEEKKKNDVEFCLRSFHMKTFKILSTRIA